MQVGQLYAGLVAFHIISTQMLFSFLAQLKQFLVIPLSIIYQYSMLTLRGILAAMAAGEVAQHATMSPADFQLIATALTAATPALAAGSTRFRTSDNQARGAEGSCDAPAAA